VRYRAAAMVPLLSPDMARLTARVSIFATRAAPCGSAGGAGVRAAAGKLAGEPASGFSAYGAFSRRPGL
jgi:hypothetical protein